MVDGLNEPPSGSEDDPHESVTVAPPSGNFEAMLRQETPAPPSVLRDEDFRAVLDAGSRAGSSLNGLARMVTDLSSGLEGARNANEQLVAELTTLRALLAEAHEQEAALRHRLALLEQELRDARLAAEQDVHFLTEQHDEFIAALVEEHEQALSSPPEAGDRATLRVESEVATLAEQVAHADAQRKAAEAELLRAGDEIARLQAQRDEAQARAAKRERERDELRAEASQLRARLEAHRPTSTTPPPPVTSRPPSFRGAFPLTLDADELDANLHPRGSTPRLPAVSPRWTPIPAEVTPSPSPPLPPGWSPMPPKPIASPLAPGDSPARPPQVDVQSAATMPPGMPAPPLKNKPDPATRPLTDYSLGDGVLSETLEGARLSSKPPRK